MPRTRSARVLASRLRHVMRQFFRVKKQKTRNERLPFFVDNIIKKGTGGATLFASG
jgi:hypothetical protein